MSMLISDRAQVMGAMRNIQRTYREPTGAIDRSDPNDVYVEKAAKATDATAMKIVNEGVAKGWRFFCLVGDAVKLWAPAKWKPVTYVLRNVALWRAIKQRGVSLT